MRWTCPGGMSRVLLCMLEAVEGGLCVGVVGALEMLEMLKGDTVCANNLCAAGSGVGEIVTVRHQELRETLMAARQHRHPL